MIDLIRCYSWAIRHRRKPYMTGCAICGENFSAWTKRGMLKKYRWRLGAPHMHRSQALLDTLRRLADQAQPARLGDTDDDG